MRCSCDAPARAQAELLRWCATRGLRVICALAAGGRADAAQLTYSRLSEANGDALATAILRRVRKDAKDDGKGAKHEAPIDGYWWDEWSHHVECVSCGAEQVAELLPIPEGVHASELGSNDKFRVRIMPVLPPLPASFGAALAARALSILGTPSAEAESVAAAHLPPLPPITTDFARKLHSRFIKGERQRADSGTSGGDASRLSLDDVGALVAEVFRGRCAITGTRVLDPRRPQFRLCRLDPNGGAHMRNVLFVTADAAREHERDAATLPPPVRARIERAFDEAKVGRRESLIEEALSGIYDGGI